LSTVSDLGLRKKKNKNRGRLEIIRDMLCAASEKTRKTRIMYQANLSYQLLEKYLKSLLESGLVEFVDDSFYLITWRGKEFLQTYDDYLERCRTLGEEIRGVRKDRLLLENMCFNNELGSKQMAKEKEVLV
jgi:predicted transcriptional regulator